MSKWLIPAILALSAASIAAAQMSPVSYRPGAYMVDTPNATRVEVRVLPPLPGVQDLSLCLASQCFEVIKNGRRLEAQTMTFAARPGQHFGLFTKHFRQGPGAQMDNLALDGTNEMAWRVDGAIVSFEVR